MKINKFKLFYIFTLYFVTPISRVFGISHYHPIWFEMPSSVNLWFSDFFFFKIFTIHEPKNIIVILYYTMKRNPNKICSWIEWNFASHSNSFTEEKSVVGFSLLVSFSKVFALDNLWLIYGSGMLTRNPVIHLVGE